MARRFVSIAFHHLATDWFTLRKPELRGQSFVLSAPSHGRLIVTAANAHAQAQGVAPGMAVADARAMTTGLHVLDEQPGLAPQLLKRMAERAIRYTPAISLDLPDGLLLDASGCSHLWGGDLSYLQTLSASLHKSGYAASLAMADTIGVAWAIARFRSGVTVIPPGGQKEALLPLPPDALRLNLETIDRLRKLGLTRIANLLDIPRRSLLRRFGADLLLRLDQALGAAAEAFAPIVPIEPYQERLPALEPIATRTGIDIALEHLLETLCARLRQENMGLRIARFTCYRVDGKAMQVTIETNRASCNSRHLFKLFEIKLGTIEPGLGIELFLIEAPTVEPHAPNQEKIWEGQGGLQDVRLAELLDRIAGRFGASCLRRDLPAEHHWPERSIRAAASLNEQPASDWPDDKPRPLHLLERPEPIQVTAPIPDYPPMLFKHNGVLHTIKKADGPERIEAEWWIETGEHRDYYAVEDHAGGRYWLFRLGHYNNEKPPCWFLHGYFA